MNATVRKVGADSTLDRKGRILLVDDDPKSLQAWGRVLTDGGFDVVPVGSLSSAKETLQLGNIQVIVADLHLERNTDESDLSGLELVNTFGASLPVIVLTGYPSVDAVLKSMAREGESSKAFDFIRKGKDGPKQLLDSVERALGRFFQNVQLQTGGAITDENAAAYVSRKVEAEIIRRLQKMEYILVIEPRQQGKTSLVNFLLRTPLDEIVVVFEVSSLRKSSEPDWYASLFEALKDMAQPRIPGLVWPATPKDGTSWRECLFSLARSLRSLNRFLVIALDEVGYEFPGMEDFFVVLREIYNSRQAEPALRHLTFMLVGARDPRNLINVDHRSAFNVAQRVRLPDFSRIETEICVRKIVGEDRVKSLAERVYEWTSGQPYLTSLLCSMLKAESTVDDVENAVSQVKVGDELHYPSIRDELDGVDQGWRFVQRVLDGEEIRFFPRDGSVQGRLELLGVIVPDSRGFCAIRNRLYRDMLSASREQQLSEESLRPEITSHSMPDLSARLPGQRARVFVSHGRDDNAKNGLVNFLTKGGAEAVVFEDEAPGGETILDSLEACSDVDFAIILATPDDVGSMRGESPKSRARQNVIFELGYFFARLGRSKVVVLYKGDDKDFDWPSNYKGFLVREMKDDWKILLARDLRRAKLHFDVLA